LYFSFFVFKEKQYAKWMAAFRLASKGRSINEISYETERESILALLNMQIPSSNSQDIQPDNYLSTKFAKKYKPKQVREFFIYFLLTDKFNRITLWEFIRLNISHIVRIENLMLHDDLTSIKSYLCKNRMKSKHQSIS